MLGMGQIFGADLPNLLLNHLLVRLSLSNMQTACTLSGTNIWAKKGFFYQALWSQCGNYFKGECYSHPITSFLGSTEALRSSFLFPNKIIKRTLNHNSRRESSNTDFQTLYFITLLRY